MDDQYTPTILLYLCMFTCFSDMPATILYPLSILQIIYAWLYKSLFTCHFFERPLKLLLFYYKRFGKPSCCFYPCMLAQSFLPFSSPLNMDSSTYHLRGLFEYKLHMLVQSISIYFPHIFFLYLQHFTFPIFFFYVCYTFPSSNALVLHSILWGWKWIRCKSDLVYPYPFFIRWIRIGYRY